MTDDTPAGRLEAFADDEPDHEVTADLRALLAENEAMRAAITRLWKLELHAADHTWMVANTDLARALHGAPVLDEIAEQAVTGALPDMLGALAGRAAVQEPDAEPDPRSLIAENRRLTDAFESLVMRIHRDFNFDAGESAAPEDEHWARLMDDLVRYAEELSLKVEQGDRAPDPIEAADSWSRAQADDERRAPEVERGLKAARDMFRRPEQKDRD